MQGLPVAVCRHNPSKLIVAPHFPDHQIPTLWVWRGTNHNKCRLMTWEHDSTINCFSPESQTLKHTPSTERQGEKKEKRWVWKLQTIMCSTSRGCYWQESQTVHKGRGWLWCGLWWTSTSKGAVAATTNSNDICVVGLSNAPQTSSLYITSYVAHIQHIFFSCIA